MTEIIFEDRKSAGEQLGEFLDEIEFENPLVFGIPRGGVIIAAQVAKKMRAPLDIVVTRKLGMPFDPEFGFGAIAPEVIVIDNDLVERYFLKPEQIKKIEQEETAEMNRRLEQYRGTLEYKGIKGRTAILVDDGIATGATIRAAIAFLRKLKPDRVIVAAPVCAKDVAVLIKKEADDTYFLEEPEIFMSVGQYYKYFPQTTDEEVTGALR